MNKCQQNLLFEKFANLAYSDVAAPSPAESITVLSEDSASLQRFCRHLNSCMLEAGFQKKPVKQVCIMSRDDEFTLNAKALYIVVVTGDGSVIASNDPEGDYRMILHRIMFCTGRVPILALSSPESAAGKLKEIAQLPCMGLYMQRASCFGEDPSGAQMAWLISALRSEMERTKVPKAPPASTQPKTLSDTQPSALAVLNNFAPESKSTQNGHVAARSTPSERALSPTSVLQRQISDARSRIRGLQSMDNENPSVSTHATPTALAGPANNVPSGSPTVNDVEQALHRLIPRRSKPLPPAPGDAFQAEDLLSDVMEARPVPSYTDILLSQQRVSSQPAAPAEIVRANEMSQRTTAAAVGSSNVNGGSARRESAINTAQSPAFVNAWSHLEKLKRDHEKALKQEGASVAPNGGDIDLIAKANSLTHKAEAERQEILQKIKIQEEFEASRIKIQEDLERLERIKQEAARRAEAAREEDLRLAARAQREEEIRSIQKSAERTEAEVRYRELESKAMSPGVEHLGKQSSPTSIKGEVVYQLPRLSEGGFSLSGSDLKRSSSCEKANAEAVADGSELGAAAKNHDPVPSPSALSKGGSWAPALVGLVGTEISEAPAQIPSPDKNHVSSQQCDESHKDSSGSIDLVSADGNCQRNSSENSARELDEDLMTSIAVGTSSTTSRPASCNQLRQSALSDHETLPHERSPQEDREHAIVIKGQGVRAQRSAAPPVVSAGSESHAKPEAISKNTSAPVTPVAPRVLIPLSRDSVDRDSPRGKESTKEPVSGGGTNMPRVIARRPSSVNLDPAPSPSAPAGPRVLLHRRSAAPSAEGTPLTSPRMHHSEDPQSRPASQDLTSAGMDEELSDYAVSPKAAPEEVSTSSDVPQSLESAEFAQRLGHGQGFLIPAHDSQSPEQKAANNAARNSRNSRNSRSSYNSDSGDGASVGVGMTLTLEKDSGQHVVTGIEPASAAAKSLVEIGDIIVKIDGMEIRGMDAAKANALLFGVPHSAVVLVVKHPRAENGSSDVVIIRTSKSTATSRVASTDAETDTLGTMPPPSEVQGSSPQKGAHSPPGLMWASLRAQVDMFADQQDNQDVQEESGAGDSIQSSWHNRAAHMGGQGWQHAGPPQHPMVPRGAGQYGVLSPHQHQIRQPAEASMPGYLGETINARPTDRAGAAVHPAAAHPTHAHPRHQMGPMPAHHHPHGQVHQAAWPGAAQHLRHPGTAPHANQHHHHGQQNLRHHAQQPQSLQPQQQVNQRPPHSMTVEHQAKASGSATPLSTPLLSCQSNPHSSSQNTSGHAGGGARGSEYDAWLQHMEQSMGRGVQPHSLKQRQQHWSPMKQPPASQDDAGGSSQIPQEHPQHAGGEPTSSTELPKQASGRSQLPQKPSPDKGSYSSIPSASAEDMSEDEVNDIMDIPVENVSSSKMHATHERPPHSLLPTQLPTSESAAPAGSTGAGGAPAFEAPPPAPTRLKPGTAAQTKTPSFERGDFGFHVAQIIDKKREMVGDYDSMRVSYVAHEGVARFSGMIIKGDYLLRVNQVDLRGKALGEVLDRIREAPARSTFEFVDAKNGCKREVTLQREVRSREDIFVQRLLYLRNTATDLTHLLHLRHRCMHADKEDQRPSFVVCGGPSVGKSTLINTILAAVNGSDYSVADAAMPTMEYTRYEQVLRGADDNPFVIADTSALTGDEAVFNALRHILKGRHKNNTKMDNGWRNLKAVADYKKRVHGVILVADARQKVSASIVDALSDMTAQEDDMPVVVAWTHVLDLPVQGVVERIRSMLMAFPSAVNFPVLHYQTGQSGNATVDFSALDMMHYLRIQSVRYLRYAQQEAAVKV